MSDTFKKIGIAAAIIIPIVGWLATGTIAVGEIRARDYMDQRLGLQERKIDAILVKIDLLQDNQQRNSEALEWIKDELKGIGR